MGDNFLIDSLMRYCGQTVTIFTTSGGLSGSGFTGVLAGICGCTVKLITDIGAPPACPVGSDCDCGFDDCGCGGRFGGRFGGWGGYGGFGYGGFGYGGFGYGGYGFRGGRFDGDGCGCGCGCGGRNWLGSVTEIPIDRIASFTHNAI